MINWFPGHMSKTLKQMQNDSKFCDCFIYVVDSRCPKSCINPEFLKGVKLAENIVEEKSKILKFVR